MLNGRLAFASLHSMHTYLYYISKMHLFFFITNMHLNCILSLLISPTKLYTRIRRAAFCVPLDSLLSFPQSLEKAGGHWLSMYPIEEGKRNPDFLQPRGLPTASNIVYAKETMRMSVMAWKKG